MNRQTAPIIALLAAACGRPAPPPPAPVSTCMLSERTGTPGPVRLGLGEPVDPAHAPEGTNDAERLLFRQLYETLLWKDCSGTLRPGLAATWEPRDGGRRWRFRLRPAARFWDGRPVRAVDVLAAWANAGPGASFDAPDDSTVTVTFAVPRGAPDPVAHPRFAVIGRGEAGWRMGTSPAGRVWHEVAADGRDLLERGVDLLVTRDPGVIGFAQGLADRYAVHALPWDRAYLLALPAEAPVSLTGADAGWTEAVHAPVRSPAGAPWWAGLTDCLLPRTPRDPPRTLRFPAGDQVARDLAARAAALSDPPVRSEAVPGGPTAPAVLALPLMPWDPCRAARRAGLTADAHLYRLVDTGAVLVVRRGTVSSVVLDWDGMPRLAGPR